jgi:hypothetical protein
MIRSELEEICWIDRIVDARRSAAGSTRQTSEAPRGQEGEVRRGRLQCVPLAFALGTVLAPDRRLRFESHG